METLFWFEDPISEQLFAQRKLGSCRSVQHALNKEQRLALFQDWLPEDKKNQSLKLLSTLEKLREALALTREDAEFCFSQLPATPKNKFLQSLFVRYLDSPLCEDKAATIW